MKGINMKAPALAEIYQHKFTYELHKRKLDRIRIERKTQLTFDQTRISHIESIKQAKSKSFAHKFNEQSHQINQSNIRFLGKLEKVKPATRYSSHSNEEESYMTSTNPYTKKKLFEAQQENTRIYNRMRSMSSSLNKDRLLKDYARSQQIKTRITRYANENNKILLKSEKYLGSSSVTKRSGSTHLKARPNFYKKEQILKNKVEEGSMKKKLNEENSEPTEKVEARSDSFFTTEPTKHREVKRKVYL